MEKPDRYSTFLREANRYCASNKNQYNLFNNYFKKNYLKHLPKNKNVKILDMGCGLGHFLYFLRKQGYVNVKGIDLNKKNIEHCKKMRLGVVQEDIFDYLKNSKENFDIIVLNDVIEHIEKDKILKLFNIAREMLNKGGKVLIKTPNCNSPYGLAGFFSDFTHQTAFTEKSLGQLAMISNFGNFKVENLYIYPNIPVIDSMTFIFYNILYKTKSIFNYLNGQKPFKVFSKNILAIFEK